MQIIFDFFIIIQCHKLMMQKLRKSQLEAKLIFANWGCHNVTLWPWLLPTQHTYIEDRKLLQELAKPAAVEQFHTKDTLSSGGESFPLCQAKGICMLFLNHRTSFNLAWERNIGEKKAVQWELLAPRTYMKRFPYPKICVVSCCFLILSKFHMDDCLSSNITAKGTHCW